MTDMPDTATISSPIIDVLYDHALDLAEEARATFDLGESVSGIDDNASMMRMAMSCEALRTTTRMMHALAWLLNQRAYLSGEMSEFQLQQHGHLPAPQSEGAPEQMELLPDYVIDLVDRSVAFYARVQRLDTAWRDSFTIQNDAVHRLHKRLDYAFAS